MPDHDTARRLTRGQLANATGCHIETIRHYEKTGLLPDPPRSAAGYRVYEPDHERRLRFILRARALGFATADVRGLLGLDDGSAPGCAEVAARTARHLADIRARIADLQRVEAVLSATAARCSGDAVPDCPVLQTLGAPEA